MTNVKKKVAKKKTPHSRKNVLTSESPVIDFQYIKGSGFRSAHIDGAIGGLSPKGFLHVALFNERIAIPTKTTHSLLPSGKLGSEILEDRIVKSGIVRELEIDLIMNEETVRELRNWLDQKLEEFEAKRKKLETSRKGLN